jgi:hypothetical protein
LRAVSATVWFIHLNFAPRTKRAIWPVTKCTFWDGDDGTMDRQLGLSDFLNNCSKSPKVNFQDEEFQTPIYNVWAFGKKTNEVSHFGNGSEAAAKSWW